MYCARCGSQTADNQRFCNVCGQPVLGATTPPAFNQPGYVPMNNGQFAQPAGRPPQLIGYSPRINDPAFKKYQKSATSWSLLFAFILAIIAIIGFPIYGNTSGDIKWPQSLYYGMGIGGMFIVIALLQILKKGSEKTWDGVVIDKKIRKYRDNNEDTIVRWHTEYVVKVRKDSGGTQNNKWIDQPGLYNYYNVGDRVRHHKGFYYYEKYDKSQDRQIMCAACMTFADTYQDQCARCKCPLLK
jgi:hypothetical protein